MEWHRCLRSFRSHIWSRTFYKHRWWTFCDNCGVMFKGTTVPWSRQWYDCGSLGC